MARKNSYSVAPGDASRSGILSRGTLAAVLGIGLLGLALVFPKEDLLKRIRGENASDNNLTIAYLQNLIRTESSDLGLHLLLVEKLAAQRDFGQAQRVLATARALAVDPDGLSRWGAQDVALAWDRWRHLNERGDVSVDGARRLEDARKDVGDRVALQVEQATSADRLLRLITQARDVGEASAVRRSFERLLDLPRISLADGLRAAREAVAQGEYELAAKLYFLAKQNTADAEARKSITMQGVKALFAGGYPVAAYEAAVRELDPSPKGDAFHWELMNLALAANKPAAAAGHLRDVVDRGWTPGRLAQLTPAQLRQVHDVAFASADLDWALRVLQAQVIQSPDPALRERVAQVLEWSSKPEAALKAWLAIAAQPGNDSALDQVLRLGPMLFDDNALLWAWRQRSASRLLSATEFLTVLQVFERLGQPQEALAFSEAFLARADLPTNSRPTVLGARAMLLYRMGRADPAIAAFSAFDEASMGQTLGREQVLAWADLLLRRGQFVEALAVLKRHKPQADGLDKPTSAGMAIDVVYWDLVADVAFEARDMAQAMTAWETLLVVSLAAKSAHPTGAVPLKLYQAERYVQHVAANRPNDQAQALAQRVHAIFESDAVVLTWVDLLLAAPDAQAIQRFFALLAPATLQRLVESAAFLERRASLQLALGLPRRAIEDLRLALSKGALQGARISMWWLLIDQGDRAGLALELAQHRDAVKNRAAFWEVLGASHLQLGQPQIALGYYTRIASDRTQKKDQDALWLSSFADVLEQAGQGALALRVRRHAHLLLNEAMAVLSERRLEAMGESERKALLVRARLSQFSSGSELGRMLAALTASVAKPEGPRDAAQQQAVNWLFFNALSRGSTELARRWLVKQQIARQSNGTYARLALALAEGDTDTLDTLMKQNASANLPIDRFNAQLQLNSPAALESGVRLADRGEANNDESVQRSVESLLLGQASRVRVSRLQRSSAQGSSSGVLVQAQVPVAPKLKLSAQLSNMQHWLDLGVKVPDQRASIGAILSSASLEVEAGVEANLLQAGAMGWKLAMSVELGSRSRLKAQVFAHQTPQDGAAMGATAGALPLESGASLEMTSSLLHPVRLSTKLERKNLALQSGTALGRTTQFQWDAAYLLPFGHPEAKVSAQIQRSVNQPAIGSTGALAGNPLAQSNTRLTLALGYGMNHAPDAAPGPATPYARRWKPFGEAGLAWTLAGPTEPRQTLLRFGASGSVLGRDQLHLYWAHQPQVAGSANRELKFQYEWLGR